MKLTDDQAWGLFTATLKTYAEEKLKGGEARQQDSKTEKETEKGERAEQEKLKNDNTERRCQPSRTAE